MTFPGLRAPEGLQDWTRFVDLVHAHWDEQPRVEILGTVKSGNNVIVRWRASRATEYVVAHIQHDGGGGGGSTYDPDTYVSRTRVDCRADRQQETTVTRSTDDFYTVWLIPSVLEGDLSTFSDYDGEGETTDFMAMEAVGSRTTDPTSPGDGLINVLAFGATGDGATDDTDAVQDAADAAIADPGGTLYFPPGTFLVSEVDLSAAGGGNEGYREISVLCDDKAFFTAPDTSTDLFDISGQRRMVWKGGRFLKARRCFTATNGLSPAYCRFEGIKFMPATASDIGACVYADSFVGNTFVECQFGWDGVVDGIDNGVDFLASASGQTNVNRFHSCTFINFKDYGLRLRGSAFRKATTVLVGCWFEDSDGIAIEAGSNTWNLNILGCYFETVGGSSAPLVFSSAANVVVDGCFFASYNSIPSWIESDASSVFCRNNSVFVNSFPFFEAANLVERNEIRDTWLNDAGSNDYKDALFSADGDASESMISWNIPRNSSTTTEDEEIVESSPASRSYADGMIRHSCDSVVMTSDLTWYDVAALTIPGSGSMAFRVIAELGTIHQGVGAAARMIEVFVDRSAGTVSITSIRNENVGGGLELQVVADSTNAKVQARRNGGSTTVVKPVVQVIQADNDIATRRVSVS